MRRRALFAFASVLVPSIAGAQELAPPPPMTTAPPSSPTTQTTTQSTATTQELDTAEQKDSGRNFELVWIDGQVGGSYVNMTQLSSSSFAIEKTSSAGPAFSLGAGIRLLILELGARLRYNALSAFNLWQANAEIGLKIPVGALDLLLAAHGGYSFVGSLDDANKATSTSAPTSNDAVKIRGFNAGADVALDYYLTRNFSVGVGGLADFLYLNRPAVAIPAGLSAEQQAAVKSDPLYQKSGSSAGLQFGGALRLGLHFGL